MALLRPGWLVMSPVRSAHGASRGAHRAPGDHPGGAGTKHVGARASDATGVLHVGGDRHLWSARAQVRSGVHNRRKRTE